MVLEAQELYRFFHSGDEEIKALRGVNVAFKAGELVSLMGPSGSGKSTLLHCLAGLDEPDGGMVKVFNEPMTRRPERQRADLRARYLGLMLQKNNVFDHLTVLQNIRFAQSKRSRAEIDLDEDIAERVGLAQRNHFLPPQLSGGERARAALAMAIAADPEIFLLDEPTGQVDMDTEKHLTWMFKRLCESGRCVIVATHNPSLAAACDRVITMRDGKVS